MAQLTVRDPMISEPDMYPEDHAPIRAKHPHPSPTVIISDAS